VAGKKSPAKRKTILFVDDESLWLDAVSNAVNAGQVRVMTAGGAEEALEKMRRNKPDLILSDVRMPVMNGFDLFEKVKSIPELQSVPYVFMSSLDDFDARKTAKDIGADDYVEKPFDLGQVRSIIADLLLRFSHK
jgi:CheY-like chemotaxis protein